MADLILKRREIIKRNLDRGYFASIFSGTMESNAEAKAPVFMKDNDGVAQPIIVDTEKANWVDSKEYVTHWNSIKLTLDKEYGEDRSPAMAPSITNIESIQVLIQGNLEESRD